MDAQPELHFDVAYPERLSRLLIFVKWLLVIPHIVVLYFLQLGLNIVTFIAWFGILFTGNYPRGLFEFAVMTMRWQARVTAYISLLRDEYPPFGDGQYPVQYELAYPPRLSRLLIFVKWLLIIPHLVVLFFLGIAAFVAFVVAWFAILITGRYPRGLFDFVVGVQRWSGRVMIYYYLLTDAYPPFTLGPTSAPTDPYPPDAAVAPVRF
ncbi:MAG: DUF4389 domain-containing protein [Thermomicrobiales bacterium]